MGKFVEEKQIIDTYIGNYVNTTNDFSRFIEGSPNFVTYYSKNINNSSKDVILNGVIETAGNLSPIKYDRINNFPLYNMEEISQSIDIDDENGLSNDIESSAIVLPNTIRPLSNDYFKINYLNKDYLFKINNVETNNINDKVFYKISYHLVTDSEAIIIERQLEDEYYVVYENLGKEAKSVIIEKDYLTLEKLDKVYSRLLNVYHNYYYNEHYNTFIYNHIQYDNFLNKFIKDNSLFIQTRSFLKNIIPEIVKIPHGNMDYDYTIFYMIQENDSDYIEPYVVDSEFMTLLDTKNTMFSLFRNMYNIHNARYYFGTDIPFNEITHVFSISEEFINTLRNIEQIDDTTIINIYDKLLIRYMNQENIDSEIIDNFSKRIKNTIENYYYIPIFLYIIKQSKKNLMNI